MSKKLLMGLAPVLAVGAVAMPGAAQAAQHTWVEPAALTASPPIKQGYFYIHAGWCCSGIGAGLKLELGSPVYAFRCQMFGWGFLENPATGNGFGKLWSLQFTGCQSNQCTNVTVKALNLPWHLLLIESAFPETVRMKIGEPFSGTLGSPSAGEIVEEVVCDGSHVTYEGELQPNIGEELNGTDPAPSLTHFRGFETGSLHSSVGEAYWQGWMRYNGLGVITVN